MIFSENEHYGLTDVGLSITNGIYFPLKNAEFEFEIVFLEYETRFQKKYHIPHLFMYTSIPFFELGFGD